MDYVAPDSITDACRALEADGSHCLAGGQSLVAMMNLGLASPARLVSLRRIGALRGIAATRDGGLRIGAMTTHAELAALAGESPEAMTTRTGPAACAPASPGARLLAQAARVVAYPAVRNRGTIGGSVALADPAADYPVALVVLDASIEIASAAGERSVRASEFFRGMFDTALVQGEIVTAVRIPAGPARAGAAYEKLSLVAGDFAIVSVAAIAGDDMRVAVGGYAMRPILLSALDAADAAQAAARQLAQHGDPPGDQRATSAYRRRVAPELVLRALRKAAARIAP